MANTGGREKNQFLEEGAQSLSGRDLIYVVLILLIGLGVRLYRLSEHSIMQEEHVVVANIGVCDLITNIKLLLINVPEYGISPGGLILYYFWIKLVGDTIWMWRLLPISFSLLSVVLVYFWGKDIRDRNVGFFSALLVSVSPFNIYISQELKNYSFVLFFSVLSWYSFYRFMVKRTPQANLRWGIINIISNIVLPWFHVIYIHLFFLQCLWCISETFSINKKLCGSPLLSLRFYKFLIKTFTSQNKLLMWLLGNVGGVIIYLTWVLLVRPNFYNASLTISEFSNSLINIANFVFISLLGNDCVSFSNELLPAWKTNIPYLSGTWLILQNILKYLNLVFLGFFIFCYLYLFIFYIGRKNLETMEAYSKLASFIYLIYAFFAMPIISFVLSFMFNMVFFLPLYFYYSNIIIYLIVSFFLFTLKSRVLRVSFVFFLVVVLSLNTVMLINFTSRPDYRNAVGYLESNVAKGEIVLDLQLFENVFEPWKIYKKRIDYYFKPVFSLQAIVDDSIEIFQDYPNVNNVWVLMETSLINWMFGKDPVNIIVDAFSQMGVIPEIIHFPGSFNLYVIRIPRVDVEKYSDSRLTIEPFMPIDYASLWCEVAKTNGVDTDAKEIPSKKLSYYFSIWPPLYSYCAVLILSSMIEKGDEEFAKIFCDYFLERYRNSLHFVILSNLIEENKKLNNLISSNYIFEDLYLPIFSRDICNKQHEIFQKRMHLFRLLEDKGFHILNRAILKKLQSQS